MSEGDAMSEEALKEALDYIDSAIDVLRRYISDRKAEDEILEDVLYHLEEAGELLDTYISRRS